MRWVLQRCSRFGRRFRLSILGGGAFCFHPKLILINAFLIRTRQGRKVRLSHER